MFSTSLAITHLYFILYLAFLFHIRPNHFTISFFHRRRGPSEKSFSVARMPLNNCSGPPVICEPCDMACRHQMSSRHSQHDFFFMVLCAVTHLRSSFFMVAHISFSYNIDGKSSAIHEIGMWDLIQALS